MQQGLSTLLLGCLLCCFFLSSSTFAAGIKVGWANVGDDSTDLSPPTRVSQIHSGLLWWEREAKKSRKDSELVVKSVNGTDTIVDGYRALCAENVSFIVGPATYTETVDVIHELNASCASSVMFASLFMDTDLKQLLAGTTLNWFTLVPDRDEASPLEIPVIKHLLEKQDHYTWSILSQQAPPGSDQELRDLNLLGVRLANDLVVPTSNASFYYTVFQESQFNVSSPDVAFAAFIKQMSEKRPSVNNFVFNVQTEPLAGFVTLVDRLFEQLDSLKPNPDTVLILTPLEYYDLSKADRKRIKYWAALALWDHTFLFKKGRKGWALGTPEQYWEKFDKHFGRHPGNWDALATASALVMDRSAKDDPNGDLFSVKFDTFWGPINFEDGNRQPPVSHWRAVQFIDGDTESIGEKKALRKGVSSPGRWKWKSYKLTSAAITAIVLATLLMLLGLAVALLAVYKFIGLWLNPPSHTDSEKDSDDKEKSD